MGGLVQLEEHEEFCMQGGERSRRWFLVEHERSTALFASASQSDLSLTTKIYTTFANIFAEPINHLETAIHGVLQGKRRAVQVRQRS